MANRRQQEVQRHGAPIRRLRGMGIVNYARRVPGAPITNQHRLRGLGAAAAPTQMPPTAGDNFVLNFGADGSAQGATIPAPAPAPTPVQTYLPWIIAGLAAYFILK